MSQVAFGPKMGYRLVSCQRVPPPPENGAVWLLGLSPSLLGTLGNPTHSMRTAQKPSGQGHPRIPWSTTIPRERDIPEPSPLLVGGREGGWGS